MKKNVFETINSVPALLSKSFRKFESRPAMLLNGGRSISYNDMRWDIFKTSNTLRFFSGVKVSTVAIFIDDSPQSLETFYSVLNIGAKAVLLRYTMSSAEISSALSEQNPDIIFIRNENISLLPENVSAGILEIADNRVLKQVEKGVHDERIQKIVTRSNDSDEVLVVTYSHGSEGTVLTRADLSALVSSKKRHGRRGEKPLDALVSYIGNILKSFLSGKPIAMSGNC